MAPLEQIAAEANADPMQITMLNIADLHADAEFNCRGDIAPIDVTDLSRSMAQHGLQLPIEVQPYDLEHQRETGKLYRLICGHRRLKAAQLLKWAQIPAIVKRNLTDAQARVRNLTENLNRKDLNIFQEAKALQNLRTAGMGQEQVSAELNKSRGWVQVRFMLLDLQPEIQQEAAAGLLNQEQIRDLYTLRHEPDRQAEAVRAIKEAREKGERVVKIKPRPKSQHSKAHQSRPAIFAMIDHIGDNLGMNLATRCLAWAAGEISEFELYFDIEAEARRLGKRYEIPKEALPEVPDRHYASSAFE